METKKDNTNNIINLRYFSTFIQQKQKQFSMAINDNRGTGNFYKVKSDE